jgi:gliding motility-associated-like protein
LINVSLVHFGFNQVITGGTASTQANDCYSLTSSANALSGYAYESQSINLNDSFDMVFSVNVGSNPAGADGMMFILRQSLDPSQLIAGGTGGLIGYSGSGLENGSLGIEIDTYQNGDLSDPAYDHISVFKNASTNHSLPNALTTPVQASATNQNIEDGNDHTFRVKWNPTQNKISVFFDCVLRLEYTGNIIDSVFDGNTSVYFGFIATTGGVNNPHSFCFSQPIDSLLSSLQDVSICKGESTQLSAGNNTQVNYSWSPSTGLNQTNIPNPIASPSSSTSYVVTAEYLCESIQDTVNVTLFETDAETFSLGNDTALCKPETLSFNLSQNGYIGFEWHDGSQIPFFSTSSTTEISVTVTDTNQCKFSDTLNLEVFDVPLFSLGGTISSCAGESVEIQVPFPTNVHKWSNGSIDNSIVISESGKYWLELSREGICFHTDTFTVDIIETPALDLGNDTLTCPDFAALLSAGSSQAEKYLWSNGSQDSTIFAEEPGTYWVQVEISSCLFSDSIKIDEKEIEALDLGQDTSLCLGDSFRLNAAAVNVISFDWVDGLSDSTRIISEPGTYALYVTYNNNCTSYGEIDVFEITCPTTLVMPNVISPNEDGINDLFKPFEISGIEEAQVRVYNRWGMRVFNGSLNEELWDGSTGNALCPSGTYFYTVNCIDVYGREFVHNGSVSIVR